MRRTPCGWRWRLRPWISSMPACARSPRCSIPRSTISLRPNERGAVAYCTHSRTLALSIQPSKPAGRDADELVEPPGAVTLVGESGGDRDVREWQGGFGEEPLERVRSALGDGPGGGAPHRSP